MDPLVDIHCHRNPAGVDARALLCVAPEIASEWRPHATLACSAVHPWDSAGPDAETKFELVSQAARAGSISAVGETGVDRFRRDIPIDAQISMFRRHATLAEETHLPLVIHSVRANADVLAERRRLRASVPWIIHGFHAKKEETDLILSTGIMVSVGSRELMRPGARDLLRRIPSGGFLLETDDSCLLIDEVYDLAAGLLECDLEDLSAALFATWLRLFGI